jgi:hypothetical protein
MVGVGQVRVLVDQWSVAVRMRVGLGHHHALVLVQMMLIV